MPNAAEASLMASNGQTIRTYQTTPRPPSSLFKPPANGIAIGLRYGRPEMRPAYYNELDSYAAQWLRNLIKAGHIPAGDVDDRSIKDVAASDLAGYGQCHFFAGIGGFGLACRLAGCPDDTDIITGGFPCQPFSVAGRQLAQEDDRHLWPVLARLIEQKRPAVFIGENVAGIIDLALDGVLFDLESAGYASRAFVVPACAVNAPHRRDRVWIAARRMADADGELHDGRGDTGPGRRAEPADGGAGFWDGAASLPCADGKARRVKSGIRLLVAGLPGCLARMRAYETEALKEIEDYGRACNRDASEAMRVVRDFIRAEAGREGPATGMREQLHAPSLLLDFLLCCEAARDGTADRSGFEEAGSEVRRRIMRGVRHDRGSYDPSREWRSSEQRCRKPSDALPVLSFVLARLAEAHRQEAGNADAASDRVNKLRAGGNAIVPQVAAEIIKAVMEIRP